MAEGTEKQLKERWLTPEGKKVKEQVVEHGTRGSPLPAKTTRHIIPGKRTYPVSLNLLKKSTEA